MPGATIESKCIRCGYFVNDEAAREGSLEPVFRLCYNHPMKLRGDYPFQAPPERLWEALMDLDLVRECIPGVKSFTPLSADKYRVEVSMRVGIVSATYAGTLELADKSPPDSYRMIVRGSGVRTNLSAEGVITLRPEGDGTSLSFNGDVQVTGMLARTGQRLMTNVAQQQIGRFFKCLDSKIE